MRNVLQTDRLVDFRFLDIRPLTPSDVDAYRAIRKRILDVGDGCYHSASYRRDKRFNTEELMRQWCTETHEHCVMGTFYDGGLVGIMAAIAHAPPNDDTVDWDSVWLAPRFRKFGIAKLAYEKLEAWTKKNGYQYAETFVRADNHRVLEIRRKRGSLHIKTKCDEVWADGSIADAHFFITNLYPAVHGDMDVRRRTIHHLEATLKSLLKDEIPDMNMKQRGRRAS